MVARPSPIPSPRAALLLAFTGRVPPKGLGVAALAMVVGHMVRH